VLGVGSNEIAMGFSSDQRQGFEAGEAARVAQMHLGQVLAGVAVAAQHLDRSVGDGERDPARLVDGQGGLACGVLSLVQLPGGLPGQQARAAYEVAREYAKQREAFGGPIAAKQAIAFKLADMAIEIDGARLLAWEAAWKLDQGQDATREATLAFDQARRISLTVTDGAVQVFGGHGYIRDYLPELHLRNARGFACFEALALV
jgi:hypothetical protein